MELKFNIMKKILFIIATIFLSIGINAQIQTVGIGSSPNDGTGDNLRTAFGKVNTNDAYLDGRADTLHVSNRFTVGEGSIYTTVQSAINAASAGDIVLVHESNYDELITLKDGVNITGVGDVVIKNTTLNGSWGMLSVNDTVTLQNIKIQRTPYTANGVIDVTDSKLTFINCTIGDVLNVRPIFATNSKIKCINTDIMTMADAGDTCSFNAGSLLELQGGTMYGGMRFNDNSRLNADVFAWHHRSIGNPQEAMIVALDSADIKVNVQNTAIAVNRNTLEYSETQAHDFVVSYDDSKATISGNEIRTMTEARGNSIMWYNNVTTTGGKARVVGYDSATINIDKWYSYFDIDNDVTGSHNIEMFNYTGLLTISNSYVEFSGHSGKYFTMGSPVALSQGTKLRMYNTTVVDNDNDNIPYGVNYSTTITVKEDSYISNCTFKQVNSDNVVTGKSCIALNGGTAKTWNVSLNNVSLFNDGRTGIGIDLISTYDPETDTVLINNVTFDVKGNPIYGNYEWEKYNYVGDLREPNLKTIIDNLQGRTMNFDSIKVNSNALYSDVVTYPEYLYNVTMSNGIYGDNSLAVHSDDTLAIVFTYYKPMNDSPGKYWSACDGKIFATHFSAGNETGKVYDFNMASANDTAYFTATELYDFSATQTFTFSAGEATNTGFTIYLQSSGDFKVYAYWFDLLNIKSVNFVRIEND